MLDDPQILIGLSFMGDGWVGQARVRNDLGLSFGAAVDFSGLASQYTAADDLEAAVAGAIQDLLTLSPQLGEPSAEGEQFWSALQGFRAPYLDEF